jgi:hypothetical protein
MAPPVFVRVGNKLINLSLCERVELEDETLSFSTGSETLEMEFDSEVEAAQALSRLQTILETKNLLLGKVT